MDGAPPFWPAAKKSSRVALDKIYWVKMPVVLVFELDALLRFHGRIDLFVGWV